MQLCEGLHFSAFHSVCYPGIPLWQQDRAFYSHRSFSTAGKKFVSLVSKKASVAQKANLVRKCLEKIRGTLTVLKKDSQG